MENSPLSNTIQEIKRENRKPKLLKRLLLRFDILFSFDKSGRTPANHQKENEKIQFHWYTYEKNFLTKKLIYQYKQTLMPLQMLVTASQNITQTLLGNQGTVQYKDVFGEHYISITDSSTPGQVFIYHKITSEDGNWKDTGFEIKRRHLNKIIKNH